MVDQKIESEFKQVVYAVATLLKSLGFSKRARTFYRLSAGNLALIEFQRSAFNDYSCLTFTLNVGIVSARLAGQEKDIRKSNSAHAHLRERIGMFLPNPHDKWWDLDAKNSAKAIADEIANLLREQIVPYLNQHLSDDGLIALWETGQSPGLTETQRARYLAELKSAQIAS